MTAPTRRPAFHVTFGSAIFLLPSNLVNEKTACSSGNFSLRLVLDAVRPSSDLSFRHLGELGRRAAGAVLAAGDGFALLLHEPVGALELVDDGIEVRRLGCRSSMALVMRLLSCCSLRSACAAVRGCAFFWRTASSPEPVLHHAAELLELLQNEASCSRRALGSSSRHLRSLLPRLVVDDLALGHFPL